MSDHHILILCPTRGRPDMARAMAQSFLDTKPVHSKLLFIRDTDDTEYIKGTYDERVDCFEWGASYAIRGAVMPLNQTITKGYSYADTIAFLNDDHRFITQDWEARIIEARQKYAVVYPDDCYNSESALTIPFFDARIAKALGFIAPRCLAHLYSDDFWWHMGNALHSIKYLPDVKIDHLHPMAGKREWDATTAAVNNSEARQKDRLAFYKYMATDFPSDVEKARKAIA